MDKLELMGKALDLIHQLYDEFGHDMQETELEELDNILDRLEALQQGWFEQESD